MSDRRAKILAARAARFERLGARTSLAWAGNMGIGLAKLAFLCKMCANDTQFGTGESVPTQPKTDQIADKPWRGDGSAAHRGRCGARGRRLSWI